MNAPFHYVAPVSDTSANSAYSVRHLHCCGSPNECSPCSTIKRAHREQNVSKRRVGRAAGVHTSFASGDGTVLSSSKNAPFLSSAGTPSNKKKIQKSGGFARCFSFWRKTGGSPRSGRHSIRGWCPFCLAPEWLRHSGPEDHGAACGIGKSCCLPSFCVAAPRPVRWFVIFRRRRQINQVCCSRAL